MTYNEALAAGLLVEYRPVGISSWDDDGRGDRYEDDECETAEDKAEFEFLCGGFDDETGS